MLSSKQNSKPALSKVYSNDPGFTGLRCTPRKRHLSDLSVGSVIPFPPINACKRLSKRHTETSPSKLPTVSLLSPSTTNIRTLSDPLNTNSGASGRKSGEMKQRLSTANFDKDVSVKKVPSAKKKLH